jgi:hypothetical protein
MTVAFDASSVRAAWGSSPQPADWTHTPVGTPRGVAVLITGTGADGVDEITGVTYGGVAMAPVVVAQDLTSEAGFAKCYFLGSGIPTGAQTVSVAWDDTSTDADKRAACVTFTAAADTEVVDSDVVQDNAADPALALDSGSRTAIRLFALHSGLPGASITLGGSLTSLYADDIATARSRHAAYQTTPGSGAGSLGWTGVSDDVALVGMAVAEIAADLDFDAATTSDVWSGGTPDTQTHTPVGTPAFVALAVITSGGTGAGTDHITGASYGALSLTRVPSSFAADTASEAGTVCWYSSVAGDTIPTGAQTVTVTQSTTSDKRFVVFTFTASDECEVVDTGLVQENTANPSVTLDSVGRESIRLAALFSGAPTSGIAPITGYTSVLAQAIATDARSAHAIRQTTPSAGAVAAGWTIASDDVAMSGIAIALIGDTPAPPPSSPGGRMRGLRRLRGLRG